MLIGAFQVQIRGKFELGIGFHHGIVRRAGIEPDVQCIRQFFIFTGFGAKQFGGVERKPRFDTLLFHLLRHLFKQFERTRMRRMSVFMHEESHRHAPITLA